MNLKLLLAVVILAAANFVCFILWIAGWPAGDYFEGQGKQSARFLFTWGFFLALLSVISFALALLLPLPAIQKFLHFLSIAVSVLFISLLTLALSHSLSALETPDCTDDGVDEDRCNGGKVIFVCSFFWLWVQAAQLTLSLYLLPGLVSEFATDR
ncbi:hypothetical protein QOT17_009299 [Balamuthia mandrillaris]